MPSVESVPKSPEHVCPKLNGRKVPELALKDADDAGFDGRHQNQTGVTRLL
jgi:hypothetical protein